MLEKVAEFDDALMEKFFDDPSTITEEEILRALRAGTLKMDIVLHSYLETTFFCATQNGFDNFYADIFIGQQISDNIQYALA